MAMTLHEWQQRWQIPAQAMSELLMMPMPEPSHAKNTEGAIQGSLRLAASQMGNNLWRNNNGAAELKDGRHLRWGLGNDSPRINKTFKSSDLIGITPIMVTPAHVGHMVGIFTAVEVKRGDWNWSGTEREEGQWKYLTLVKNKGGFATFAKSIEDYKACLNITG